jgi:hypothetical protein
LVCRLKKALYGLKQAPRHGTSKLTDIWENRDSKRCPFDSNLYVKSKNGDVVILVIYVDDIIITGSKVGAIAKVKSKLCLAFDMTDLGLLHYCLGVEVL